MAYEIVWESRGAYKRFYGHVNDEEMMQSLTKIESDPRFDDLRYVINDFLGIEGFSVSEDSVHMMSALDNAAATSNPNIRIAIVATDLRLHALAKLYIFSPLNVYPTDIFLNIDDAKAWISSAPSQADFRIRCSPRR
jgi:hypothetical protein